MECHPFIKGNWNKLVRFGDKENNCHSLGSSPTYWEVTKHFDKHGSSVDSLV